MVPATLVVMNSDNAGADSLRAAIEQANTDPGPDTITFAPDVTGTITLISALPDLTSDIVLNGPGASSLTVARSYAAGTPAFRIFNITPAADVTISGLTLSGGYIQGIYGGSVGGDASGGGITNAGTLTIFQSTVRNNSVVGGSGDEGGGIGYGGGIVNTGTLTIIQSTLSGNRATGGAGPRHGGGGAGGGIYNNGGMLTITNSTFSDNSVMGGTASGFGQEFVYSGSGFGGGINNNGGTLTITSSTFNENCAIGGSGSVAGNPFRGAGGGGGIAYSGSVTTSNSIFNNLKGGNFYRPRTPPPHSRPWAITSFMTTPTSPAPRPTGSTSTPSSARWPTMAGQRRPTPCFPAVRPSTLEARSRA